MTLVIDEPKDILPSSKRDEMILETTATLVNLVPGIGGAISSVLFGISGDRRFERVRAFLEDLDLRVGHLSEEQDRFVRSDEFEDLLTETLERVSRERNEDKRRLYAAFLLEIIDELPTESYDERLHFLRIIEELQGDHIRILRAMAAEPDTNNATMGGSRKLTLEALLPDIPSDRLTELTNRLGDLRVIDAGMLAPIVTGPSAIDLRPVVTPFGARFVRFLRNSPPPPSAP
jgi:hypothetical protein